MVKMGAIKTVGVVGAGQMGNGIAHVCALAGYDVLLNDADPARIDAAIQIITKNLGRQVHRAHQASRCGRRAEAHQRRAKA